jgi:hypothetical protein
MAHSTQAELESEKALTSMITDLETQVKCLNKAIQNQNYETEEELAVMRTRKSQVIRRIQINNERLDTVCFCVYVYTYTYVYMFLCVSILCVCMYIMCVYIYIMCMNVCIYTRGRVKVRLFEG